MFNRPHPFMSRPGPLGHDLVVDSFSLSYTCVSDAQARSTEVSEVPSSSVWTQTTMVFKAKVYRSHAVIDPQE